MASLVSQEKSSPTTMSAAAARPFGEHLPDQVDRIAALSDAQLGLITDVRETYKERAALEKDYATKLSALAKKAADRKNKRMASLVVGEEPTVAWGDDTLRRSTLENAYSQLITSIESTAQDHSTLSDVLVAQVADAMKALERKHGEMKAKQIQFYQKVLSDRDKTYNDRLKRKQKYDEECLEIEAYRAKKDRVQDDRHATRATGQYETQVIDMQNSKNTYIIATAVANSAKNRFYDEDLPLIENDFQRLQTNLINNLVNILLHASTLHTNHITALQSRISASQQLLSKVDPAADQNLYIEYNIRPFSTPNDWAWEPCAGYYDTGNMVIEPGPKVFLQNKLQRSRMKLQETKAQAETKSREVEKLLTIVNAYTNDRSMGDLDDVTNNYLDAQHQLTSSEFVVSTLVTETETITAALGGDEGNQFPHSFKSSSFTVPTTCAYCKSSIWGLTKQGKTCTSCKISVHAKCELKVPADCGTRLPKMPGSPRSPRSSTFSSTTNLSRTDSRASSFSTRQTGSSSVASSASLVNLPHPEEHEEKHILAHVLYDFTPTSAYELRVTGGQSVKVLEEDDGSGWVKVEDMQGGKGLVPASYVQASDADDPEESESESEPEPQPQPVKRVPPPPNRSTKPSMQPKTPGSGQYVKGVYPYQADGPDEIDVEEGELIELSAGPNGGQNYADGWWEGYDKSGKKGIFPSNYVTIVHHYGG